MFEMHSVNATPDQLSPEGQFLPTGERGRWHVLRKLEKFSADVDAYRERYGKEVGELLFLEDNTPHEVTYQQGNLLLVGGVANLWQYAIGNGVTTPGNALAFLSNANAVIGIGDSTTAEAFNQYDLQAGSNKYYQGMDAGHPIVLDVSLPSQSTVKTISGATNASPIVVTSTSHGYSTGDVAYITGVAGNTAANGLFQLTVVDANTFQLNGSTGSGAYTSGGLVTRSNVIVFKATVGPSNANYAWNEWVVKNGTGANSRCTNRKVSSLGSKSSGTWALTVAIAIA